jgi:acetyl esterase/lipase
VQSLRSRVVNAGIGLVMRRVSVDADTAYAQIRQQDDPNRSTEPPSDVVARASVDRSVGAGGWLTYELSAPGAHPVIDVVHFHGGGYIADLNDAVWRFAHRLATDAPARLHLPVYALAPGSTATTTIPVAADLLAERLATAERPVVVSGDSAGAGIALLATLRLRDRGGPLPAELWLQGPWLDTSLSSADTVTRSGARDPMLSVDYLRVAAAAWAGELRTDDPRVSPHCADLQGLPPMLIHVGGRDLGATDAHRFCDRARSAGVDVDLRVVPGQIHGYWALKVPEAKQLRRDLVAAARRVATTS